MQKLQITKMKSKTKNQLKIKAYYLSISIPPINDLTNK